MPYSLYFHIPFCVHRCAYCDFNTYAGQEDAIPAYVEALCAETRAVARTAGERLEVHTVFFGGGTPSLLTPGQFERILAAVHENFTVLPGGEFTLEANPGTLPLETLQALRGLGFNRLSLGVQSAHPDELRQLERIHDYFDVIAAVSGARRAGFDNLNLDLIYGLPGQSPDRWQASLELALGLDPEHFSLYALTIEHGTPFGHWTRRGLLPSLDPDAAADMYEWAGERLEAAGFGQYEISNWAKPGGECRHNLQYWRNQPYLGLGAGAHGYAGGMRYSNVLRIKAYIERLLHPGPATPVFPLSPAAVDQRRVTPRVEMQETLITGLRLTGEGLSAAAFRRRFGVELTDVFGKEVTELLGLGLLEWTSVGPEEDRCLRLTRRGRLLGNQVFVRFVD